MNNPFVKIFDREDIGGATRINEDQWFSLFQPLLLKIANTSSGRDLLCIDESFPKIHEIGKNYIKHYKSLPHGGYEVKADFRVGAKWANVIRYKWHEFKTEAKKHYEREEGKILIPSLYWNGVLVAARATDTFYPNPAPGTTSISGGIAGASNADWATAGNNTTGSTFTGNTMPAWARAFTTTYSRGRCFALFDTSTLTSGANISAGVISFYGASSERAVDTAFDYITIVQASPASNTAVAAADFIEIGSITNPTEGIDSGERKPVSGFSTSGYTDFTLNSTGRGWISKTGVSKFGVREGDDTQASAFVGLGSEQNNIVEVYTANETGTSKDPKLVVTYTIATATGNFLMFM